MPKTTKTRKTKTFTRSAAVALATAAAFTLAGPVGSAHAINRVECRGGENFLKIYSHSGGTDHVTCFANAGKTRFNAWVDKIETGNNTVIFKDANGDSVKIEKNHVYKPKNAAHVVNIEIL